MSKRPRNPCVVGAFLLPCQLSGNPFGIAAEVEYPPDGDKIFGDRVVDSIGKSTRKKAVMSVNLAMNACKNLQRINV